MLDIFANVFGKSKKSGHGNANGSSGAALNDDSPSESEGFVFVRQQATSQILDKFPNDTAFDRNVMLTNEMIMGSSSSIVSSGNNNSNSAVNYPSLDGDIKLAANNTPNPILPFSSTFYSGTPMAVQPRRLFGSKSASPIDNVPMAFSIFPSNVGGGNYYREDAEIVANLNKVEQFLNSSSSIYSFRLEKSILREAIASNTRH